MILEKKYTWLKHKQYLQHTVIDCIQNHYNHVIMCAMASQIISLTIVYSTVYTRRISKKTSKRLWSTGVNDITRDIAKTAPNWSGCTFCVCFRLYNLYVYIIWSCNQTRGAYNRQFKEPKRKCCVRIWPRVFLSIYLEQSGRRGCIIQHRPRYAFTLIYDYLKYMSRKALDIRVVRID